MIDDHVCMEDGAGAVSRKAGQLAGLEQGGVTLSHLLPELSAPRGPLVTLLLVAPAWQTQSSTCGCLLWGLPKDRQGGESLNLGKKTPPFHFQGERPNLGLVYLIGSLGRQVEPTPPV